MENQFFGEQRKLESKIELLLPTIMDFDKNKMAT